MWQDPFTDFRKNRGSIGSYVRRATAVTLAAAMLGASLPVYAKAPETGNVTNVVSAGKGRNIMMRLTRQKVLFRQIIKMVIRLEIQLPMVMLPEKAMML